jgi:glycosyltransferase involved in cell wall biosynthesis
MTVDAVGGVWSYALDLCAALPDLRFILATLGPRPRPAQRAAVARLAHVTLAESDFRLEWMTGGQNDIAASQDWLLSLARQHEANLVHVNGYAQVPPAGTLPSVTVAHSDVLSWWAAVQPDLAPPDWDAYQQTVAAGLRRASRIVALTAAGRADFRRHYGLASQNITVIPNGIDVGSARAAKHPVVFGAGRIWDKAKNLRLLDEIADDLPWRVEIAGDTAHPEHGSAGLFHAQALGVLDRSMVRRRLSEAAIYAAPALYEPFGLGILEAAAAGCALLLGDIPSLRENWDGAAILLPPRDPAVWRAAALRLINDGGERKRLGKMAQARAQRFTLARAAQCYRALYSELLDNPANLKAVA